MFEDQTFENILNRMLSRVSPDVDKREGSIIYDTLAPTAAELAQVYTDLELIMNLTFARTSSGEYLDFRVEESGVRRRPATRAIRKGVFNIDVPIGSRFRGGDVIYQVTERIEEGVFMLEAETEGTIGNEYFGRLLPIDNIEGLSSAVLDEVLIPGTNEESDPALYERYVEEVNATRYGGNVDQYREWISKIQGVGRFRVQPLWNGRGTVRALITDANNQVPSQELIDLVQNTLDPYQDGMGYGLVPVGHIFTAAGAIPKTINISMKVVFEEGYSVSDIQDDVNRIIDDYFSEINFVHLTIRQAVLLSRLIALEPIKDITELKLNDIDGNIEMGEEEIAVRGVVTIVED